ncbi:hypothetical protein I2I05_06365 [Hymenobacter sp. BT683]|uniref:Uncharacterized protein n=1 Tax=Hymenobacter jeongseonensis TaxID=2791027 RepID=A0ABS0IF82_9BACT|nr:hypothetical protein [Hymenobacter jeongseonensis]MBF9237015.1 hypothetical protein [Hymenobacter jeongseonensis]
MRPFFFLSVLLCLAGCDQKSTSQQEAAPPQTTPAPPAPAAIAPPRPLAFADTAAPYTTLPGFFDSVKVAPQVRINGTVFRLQTTAQTDSTRPLRYALPPTAYVDGSTDDSTQSNVVTGFEGTYTFRLLRPDGKPQFVQKLLKSAFGAAVGKDMAVEAAAMPPVFSGYLPAFNALAFELSFYPPDSDAGGELLLLLDATTGRVIHKELARWMSGCNSETALSPNGRTLLTSTEILQSNGRSTEIDNIPGREVAGTLLVNDQTVLVAYTGGYDNKGEHLPLKGPNAELMNLNGRRLAAFNLESIDGGLGSRMLSKYVGQTRSHYLFDEANGKVGIISAEKPVPARILKLSQIPIFRAPLRPTEVRIHFAIETGTRAAFYIDTVSGNLRQRVSKPSY